MAKRTITLITDAFPSRPALDTAISRIILQEVSKGSESEMLRLYRPGAAVLFGPQDIRVPGYRDAVSAAFSRGFEAVERLSGGRAAVFHEETLAFAWTVPGAAPHRSVYRRFEELASIMARAFCRLGVDARVGQVEGEYCPGGYSVNARGLKKLMGVGQRLMSNAAHVGGVVVWAGSQRVRDVLGPVYDAMGVLWDPATVGSIVEEVETVAYEDVQSAILDEFRLSYDLVASELKPGTVAMAKEIENTHLDRRETVNRTGTGSGHPPRNTPG